MFEDLKKLSKQSFTYGLGDVMGRLGAFLLLPLYTNYLTPDEFGTLELFYMTATILALFLGRQLSHATLRFYFEYDSQHERNLLISTSFLLYIGISVIILSGFAFFSESFSKKIFSTDKYYWHFIFLFSTMFFDLSKEILFAYIRAIEKAAFYVWISFFGLLLKLGFCIYLVVILKLKVLGVLAGNLSGSFVVWCILSIFTFKRCGFGLDPSKFKEVLNYSLPLIFVGISGTIIGNAGRFFLKMYVSLGAVGLYALALRFSSLLLFFAVTPFSKAYGPFRFSIMKQKNAKEIYARVTTYFSFLCAWACLAIASFSSEVIRIMSDESYWAASSLIPVLLLSSFFGSALYYMFQIGVYLQKSTKILSYVFAIAAIFDVICMILLVPRFGSFGAASSQVLTHAFIAFSALYFSNRVYFIPYEWIRLLKIGGVAVVLIIACHSPVNPNPYISIIIKVPIVALFPIILWTLKFFNRGELVKIRQFRFNLKTSMK